MAEKDLSMKERNVESVGGLGQYEEIVHLPVAPQVTAMTRFSSVPPRKISFMMPAEAVAFLDRVYAHKNGKIDMVAITGPGDPLAVPDTTLKTLRLVRDRYPEKELGLKTLGIGAEKFAEELSAIGVGYVEMTVNGVKEDVLEKIYAWIRPGQKTLKIGEAVKLLINEQKNGVSALKYHGISVTVATTLYPGINLKHVGRISRSMMELGAESMALMPYEPESGSEVVHELPAAEEIEKAMRSAGKYLPVTEARLTGKCSCTPIEAAPFNTLKPPSPTPDRPNVAVISSNGVEIDLHLGKADKILVYGPREDGLICLREVREAPSPGGGAARWMDLAALIDDCFVLLAAHAGGTPRQILAERNIPVLITDDQIEGVVDTLCGGSKKKKSKKAA
jgi:nitrogen fixation protein NifB